MSDAATDAMVEEDLRRCRAEGHRLFFFRVGAAEVAVCSRCQIRFIEDVTAGDGSEWDQWAREEQQNVGESRPSPNAAGTPTTNPQTGNEVGSDISGRVGEVGHLATGGASVRPDSPRSCIAGRRLCRTRIYRTPSGKRRWVHANDCPDSPGEPIDAGSYVGVGRFDPEPWRRW